MTESSHPPTAKIETVEALVAAYPDLMKEMARRIDALSAEQCRQDFPGLYGRLMAWRPAGAAPHGGRKGFLLTPGDPYAASVARTYARLKGLEPAAVSLPLVLPFDDPATPATLNDYVLRANGGGDWARARPAEEALRKCKNLK